mmetsp:Transcript_2402/g.5533  ORF Transcript_2402/g.5533 Transcript_2402/m.5533 type:complete len:95 (-) Transcript_2402:2431-2715(-)
MGSGWCWRGSSRTAHAAKVLPSGLRSAVLRVFEHGIAGPGSRVPLGVGHDCGKHVLAIVEEQPRAEASHRGSVLLRVYVTDERVGAEGPAGDWH